MTTYTPNQSVTVIDAKDVRGPGRIHRKNPRIVFVEFEHHTASGREWDAGTHWGISDLPDRGLQILPEPFTGPKGEEDLTDAVRGILADPKGDSVKPLRLRKWRAYSNVVEIEHTRDLTVDNADREAVQRSVNAYVAALSSAPDALSEGEETPEARAEQFIQAAIDGAPEPLRRLGEYLTTVLDEDQWPTAEQLLLAIATTPTTGAGQELVDAAKEAVDTLESFETVMVDIFPRNARACGQAADALRTAIANTQVAGPEKATLRRAKDRVIEQACEAVAAGPGEHERLRRAVLEYYRVCGDDAMADTLEAQQ